MKKSTFSNVFVTAIASFALICLPTSSLAQHGGGHAGGGGGGHMGGGFGGGGGFRGGGGYGGGFGGYHGGYGGGAYGGGYHGGTYSGGYAGRGGFSGAYSGRGARSSRPWSWEGGQGAARNTSPGWHGFSGNNGTVGHSNAMNAGGRPGGAITGSRTAGNFTSHEAAADGNWHSFAPARGATTTSASHTNVVATGTVWRGGNWVGGWRGGAWGGWRGGWGWGWGRPGWNWGWGCCGWGWGGWGWGLGWGGWGVAWSPFWAWPPYYYDPWLYSYDAAPDVLYPYPG